MLRNLKLTRILLFPPAMSTVTASTLVKCCHRLIRRSSLNLHKIGSFVFTLGALLLDTIHVLPGSCSSKHVVNLLELGVRPAGDALGDVVDVRAGGATEPVARVETLFTL